MPQLFVSKCLQAYLKATTYGYGAFRYVRNFALTIQRSFRSC